MAWLPDDTPLRSYKIVKVEWEPTSPFDTPEVKLRKIQENEAAASEVKRRYEISNRFVYPQRLYKYDEDGIVRCLVFKFGSPHPPWPSIGDRQAMLARAQMSFEQTKKRIAELEASIQLYSEEVINADQD